ncbi:MAG: acyl-CoA dehydrogenase [Gammaproteobacteria bacterium]|nr:acyl-CoA dehydrogenase [Gammaproteobacteria bacterium]MBT4492765.1 acyl-CoA dehydrogenase [Gammaproteobacteria bacterium]
MSELALFSDEVRTFLDESLTPELQKAGKLEAGIYAEKPVAEEWLKILDGRGWAVPGWPEEWGGAGWSAEQHAIWQRELTLAAAPSVPPNGIKMVAPAIMYYATQEQKEYYLPRIRKGEDWWAQGYSEPGAGSDLSSLKCAAVRDGDDYVINGTKIWTTHAHYCNRIFCLVRTDSSGRQQQGITFLLFDLDLPGIEIQPIISISGDHEFNQVFFTDVRVPVTGRLGEENDGWSVAKYLLTHERGGKTATAMMTKLEHLKEFLDDEARSTGIDLRNDESYRRNLAALNIELETYVAFENRVFDSVAAGESIGTVSSILKIRRTELRQRIDELVMDAVHHYGLPYQPEIREFRNNTSPVGSFTAATAAPRYLNNRAATIYAGSNEIQRNILAKQSLGL